jgi:hypothetical protein
VPLGHRRWRRCPPSVSPNAKPPYSLFQPNEVSFLAGPRGSNHYSVKKRKLYAFMALVYFNCPGAPW